MPIMCFLHQISLLINSWFVPCPKPILTFFFISLGPMQTMWRKKKWELLSHCCLLYRYVFYVVYTQVCVFC